MHAQWTTWEVHKKHLVCGMASAEKYGVALLTWKHHRALHMDAAADIIAADGGGDID